MIDRGWVRSHGCGLLTLGIVSLGLALAFEIDGNELARAKSGKKVNESDGGGFI